MKGASVQMKRFPGSRTLAALGLAALGLAVATAAAADQNAPAGGPHGRMEFGFHRMEKCLSTLNLPAATSATIDETLASGKITLRADGQAVGAAHKQMEADLASGAEKSVLGQDALNQDAARTKLKSDAEAIRARVLGQLSAEQLEQYNACASAPKGGHSRPGSGPASSD